jgi:hypothetical protein
MWWNTDWNGCDRKRSWNMLRYYSEFNRNNWDIRSRFEPKYPPDTRQKHYRVANTFVATEEEVILLAVPQHGWLDAGIPSRGSRFTSTAVHVGSVVDKCNWGRIFFLSFGLPQSTSFHRCSMHISSRGLTMGRLAVQFRRDIVSHHPNNMENIIWNSTQLKKSVRYVCGMRVVDPRVFPTMCNHFWDITDCDSRSSEELPHRENIWHVMEHDILVRNVCTHKSR